MYLRACAGRPPEIGGRAQIRGIREIRVALDEAAAANSDSATAGSYMSRFFARSLAIIVARPVGLATALQAAACSCRIAFRSRADTD